MDEKIFARLFILAAFVFLSIIIITKHSKKDVGMDTVIPPLVSIPTPIIPPSPSPAPENSPVPPPLPEKPQNQIEVPNRPYIAEYHNQQEFWQGYHDGWHGHEPKCILPAYNQGYVVGCRDRRYGQAIYFEQYYSPIGLQINIR